MPFDELADHARRVRESMPAQSRAAAFQLRVMTLVMQLYSQQSSQLRESVLATARMFDVPVEASRLDERLEAAWTHLALQLADLVEEAHGASSKEPQA